MLSAKTKTVVVRITRGFGPCPESPVPALVERRGRKPVEMYLSPETRDAMGRDLVAYFEAEVVGWQLWIGQRLPDGNRGW